jgi:hypothetical protein
MSWAAGRRAVILAILGAVLLAAASVVLIAVFYQAPTCADTKQDGDETGVDCGGSCALLCSAQQMPVDVLFVRALAVAPGRTDVIAYVENPNPSSGVAAAPFTINLYGPDGVLVATKDGEADLPPATVVPVFVPDFFSGYQAVARAFLSFDTSAMRWQRAETPDLAPKPGSYTLEEEATAPRITATIKNPAPVPAYDVKVIATAFDASGNAVGASQTVLPSIPAGADVPATFTWNAPFGAAVARVDILPILALPAP